MKKLYFFFILLSINLSQNFNISGFITDSNTGESIVGANVFLNKTNYGTTTDLDGYFIIFSIPEDNYNLVITYLGYEKIEKNISISENNQFDFELTPKPLSISEVTVTSEAINRKTDFQTSRIKLNTLQLRNMPQVAEADLFRSLQSLPGVLTQNDFSTGLVIRGGNTDQNLILLDGITVYNPSHVGGVFSNFILDAIKEVDLQKGGYNAEYGGRLSAVLKVTSREGNSKKFNSSISMSALSGQAILEGPINKGAWIVAGRRTYFDQIFKGTDYYFPYFFYDLQGHIYQDITTNQRFSLSWYKGEDNLKWDEEFGIEAIWKNNTISLNYRVFHSQQLLSNWMLAKSKFDIFFGIGRNSSNGIVEEDYIDDLTFRNDWTLFLTQNKQFKFGFEVKKLDFYYNSDNNGDIIFNLEETPIEGSLYAKYKLNTNKILFQPGFRINYFNATKKNWFFDPRLQLKYFIDEDRYFNLSIGKYHQFIATAQDDYNPSIIDAWLASDKSIEPGSSYQITLGFEEYFNNNIFFQVESYYKKLNNMITFVQKGSTVNATEEFGNYNALDSLVDIANGYSYGLELFVQKQTGKINGWVNYSYSVSRKIFNDKEYYANWDRTHVFNILGNYKLSEKWGLNLKWTYQTGQPYTPIIGYYQEAFPPSQNEYEVIPGGRNSSRYPNYHRLDFGAVRNYKWNGWNIDLFIQIINLYWQKNVFVYNYVFGDSNNGIDDDGDGIIDNNNEDSPIRNEAYGFPIIPSIGVKIDF